MGKFKKIAEELVKNKDLVNEVSKMENIDEIYQIFKNIDPELKKEELNNLIEKIENSDLENISGGISLNKKVLSSSLGALMACSSLGVGATTINNNHYDNSKNTYNNIKTNGDNNTVTININSKDDESSKPVTFYANNSQSLNKAVISSKDGDKIILSNNIDLDCPIEIKTSIDINLNGYKIKIDNDKNDITCGKKQFNRREETKRIIPGYYSTEYTTDKITHPGEYYIDSLGHRVPKPPTEVRRQFKQWHPPVEKIEYEDIYDYFDDISITMENGEILGAKGLNGRNGLSDTWFDYHGINGKTPKSPIYVLSGKLRFNNMSVIGGNGGNGGNGSYQTLWHLPIFGGGRGGAGGNGGNSGHAVILMRKKCKVVWDNNSTVKSGKPGEGGKSGEANQDYWVYSGMTFLDGKKGNKSSAVDD